MISNDFVLYEPRLRPVGRCGGPERYSSLWMNIASVTALESSATRRKVGCVVVTQSMGLYTGYNGVIGGCNECENDDGLTKDEVIHAEQNAFDKMLREGVSSKGSILYVTLAPCIECAKRIVNSGIRAVYYRDEYHTTSGIDFIARHGIECRQWDGVFLNT